MLTTPVQLTLTLFYATAIVAALLWIRSRISVADTGPTGEQLVAEDEEVKLW